MSWRSTPPIAKTRRIYARWPLPRLRARSVPAVLLSFDTEVGGFHRPQRRIRWRTPTVVCLQLFLGLCIFSFVQSLYQNWVLDACRNILAILEDMPSLRPPIDHLCELLPRLQARYYSIASSSKVMFLNVPGLKVVSFLLLL